VKVLPEHFADDPDRLSRFQREAQLLASLNHPNIAQIYGLEQTEGTGCIVMELVEGDTLAEKLRNGPLPIDEAVEIAKQIADALAAAHERGIVHRDLKPANIKFTTNGTVKVLDFGLAKLASRAPESQLSMMPTKVSGSMAGMVVGTAGYMSPEQARGREVDARTDVWAFGCVLFEMLTARQAFAGETATDMIARIVTSPPDLDLLPAGIPSRIRLLLEATLNKNVQQRLQHIGDMRLFLDEKFFPEAAPAAVAASKSNRGALLIASLVALAAVIVAAALFFRPTPPQSAPEMRFELAPPDIASLIFVSPDGQKLAYIAQPANENRAVWMRPINSLTAQKLPRTDNPSQFLYWSPDSKQLVFFADGKLKKVDVAGGAVQVISDFTQALRGLTWNRAGVILFSKDNILVRVADGGGEIQPVIKLDENRKEQMHLAPVFLPDGDHFLYFTVSGIPENSGFFVGSLQSGRVKRLAPLPSQLNNFAVVPGYFLVVGGGRLTAQRFNADALTLEGDPVTVVEGIENNITVSETGLLLYRTAATAPPSKQLLWFDRTGRQLGQIGGTANYGGVELSPKGDRVAVDINTNNNRDIWVIDIARAVPSRITFESGIDWSPSWSSDGNRLVFGSNRTGDNNIYQKASSGVGSDELVFQSTENEIPVHVSHDGKYVVFSRPIGTNAPAWDTWVLDTTEKKASAFLTSPFDKVFARVSPDSRWIAYATNDSGMYQIVVQSFPDPNQGKWQITAQGGIEPKWRRDGRELYYLALDGTLMAVPIKADKTFVAGTPERLFETQLPVGRTLSTRDRRYDVAPDGRFLIVTPSSGNSGPAPMTAVVNWFSGLAQK